MDLAPFTADDFDPKTWINGIFKGQEKNDKYASSLVMRLQLAIQEVNTSLEDTSQQLLSGLPRVVRDVESLGQEASLLKTQMDSLMADVQKVSTTEVSSSLDTLVKLETVKSRLAASSQALRQADNWTTLATEVEELLESGDLEGAAGKVVELQHCLSVLSQTPDSEDRADLLNNFQLRIEAMASPHVVEAFTQHNLSESIKYSGVLRRVGRSSQALSYFHQCSLAALAAVWPKAVENDSMTSPNLLCLVHYFDHLATHLRKQVEWVSEVFSDCNARLVLCQLATAALTDLDPPLVQVVSAAVKLQEDPLQLLCNVRTSMDEFLVQAQHTLSSDDEGCVAASASLTRAVYAPLSEQLQHYQQYESAALLAHLSAAGIESGDLSETLLQLREYCGKMAARCDLAATRCLQVSGMAASQGLVAAVAEYVAGVVAVLAGARKAVAALDDTIAQDWTVFSTCLDLINTAGVVLLATEECDEALQRSVSSAEICWKLTPFTLTPAALLTPTQTSNLKNYLQQITEGGSGGALGDSLTEVREECRRCVTVALQTISSPLQAHLNPLSSLPVWSTNQPHALSSAFSPQEYVTQMGQYLLTLPQHLEPLLMSPSPALNRALQQASPDDVRHAGQRAVSESEVSAADFLIGRVALNTCTMFADAVLRIPLLHQHAHAQLITDIEYICNILEDLGVGSCRPLDHLLALLKAAPREFSSVSERLEGAPIRMIAAVRQMRDISATT